jgi:23S rRNA pseudouridine1911/1915/1917 synthase
MQDPVIIYEDNHFLAIAKPSGWLVQGDITGDETLTDWAKNYLKEKYEKKGAVYLHPTHRIDRPVSGLVLFARTDKALIRMNKLFRERLVHKTYWALTIRPPKRPMATLQHWLRKDEERNITFVYPEHTKGAQLAILSYDVAGTYGPNTLVKVNPQTGKPHQIRAQLAAIGCSILGDLKYGAPEPCADASIALHSRRLEFIHPIRLEPITLEAPLPKNSAWESLTQIAGH